MVFYTNNWTIWTVRLESFTGFLDCNLNNFLVLQSCFINKSNLFFKITFGHLVLDFVLVAHLYIVTPCCCPYLECQLLRYIAIVYFSMHFTIIWFRNWSLKYLPCNKGLRMSKGAWIMMILNWLQHLLENSVVWAKHKVIRGTVN